MFTSTGDEGSGTGMRIRRTIVRDRRGIWDKG
jgi:hypothetical protein